MRIPRGVRGKHLAGEALRGGPLKEAGRANSSGIESIPIMLTNALPAALRLGRPIAVRAADAWVGGALLMIVKDIMIQIWLNNRRRQAVLGFAL